MAPCILRRGGVGVSWFLLNIMPSQKSKQILFNVLNRPLIFGSEGGVYLKVDEAI